MTESNEQTKQITDGKPTRKLGLFGLPRKHLSKSDVVKSNSAFFGGILNRAVKTLDKMEQAGRIPDKVAMRDGTTKEVNHAGIRAFCEKFQNAHAEHLRRMQSRREHRHAAAEQVSKPEQETTVRTKVTRKRKTSQSEAK